MIDRDALAVRIGSLESYLHELRGFLAHGKEKFVATPALHHLAERLKGWMGLRNILVHLYLKVDHGRVYDAICDDLHELQTFLRAAARLLVGT